MTKTKSLQHILVLSIAVGVLMSYQFIGAAWTNPPAAAPSNNVDAPLNIGTTNQIKLGDITAVNLKAGNQVWAFKYCDETGSECIVASDIGSGGGSLPTCAHEQIIYYDGDASAWKCTDWPSGGGDEGGGGGGDEGGGGEGDI